MKVYRKDKNKVLKKETKKYQTKELTVYKKSVKQPGKPKYKTNA